MKHVVLAALALALLAGCAKTPKVRVESDGCWEGTVGSSAVDGCGNKTYSLTGDPKCATFIFKATGTYLRARVNSGPWAETTVHYDSITVCK